MPADKSAACATCGKRLPKRAHFCPECGSRVDAETGETVVDDVPPNETGPVPVHVTAAEPRFFGVTPPMAVFGLMIASLVLSIVLFAAGHPVSGGLLLALAGIFLALFAAAARRLPETTVARLSGGAMELLRSRAGFAVEALAAQSSARMEVFRLRRELGDLAVARQAALRDLGEAVYLEDEAAADAARTRVRELDEDRATKEAGMEEIVTGAQERIQRAQLQVQPTQVVEPGPVPVPEPAPVPSEPPEPAIIPEPTPEPSVPPEPARIPEPSPEPSPPATPPEPESR